MHNISLNKFCTSPPPLVFPTPANSLVRIVCLNAATSLTLVNFSLSLTRKGRLLDKPKTSFCKTNWYKKASSSQYGICYSTPVAYHFFGHGTTVPLIQEITYVSNYQFCHGEEDQTGFICTDINFGEKKHIEMARVLCTYL